MKLPKKLSKEPLIEALFEVRFDTSSVSSLAALLPGFFLQKSPNLVLKSLPTNEIPAAFRRADQNLKYSALVSLEEENFLYNIGDYTLGVSCKMPYQGWAHFKPKILKTLQILNDIPALAKLKVERYSMKYTDIIEATGLEEQAAKLDWKLHISDFQLKKENFQVRIEKENREYIHIISLLSSAVAVNGDVEKKGLIVDIDTLKMTKNKTLQELMSDFDGHLNKLHEENKREFFMCLTEVAIKELGPVYE